MKYWNAPAESVLEALSVDAGHGLSPERAATLLEEHGPNAYRQAPPEGVASMVARQFRDVANLILVLAACLSLALAVREGHGYLEPVVILAVIALNVTLAVTQERGAERALEALRDLNGPVCLVLRGGARVEVPTAEVVPGDVVLLKTGDLVPADARLVEATGLAVDESSLTGESEPADKDARALVDEDAPIGDRANMVFSGCLVTAGNAVAVVCSTGMNTEMGKIAGYLNDAQKLQTPLQRRLNRVSRMVSAIAALAAAALLATGLQQGEEFWSMVLAAVSLAVAAVPETLQLIVTLTLSQGVHNMVGKHALIRRLPAVETLGSTSVICSDKTGTLTQNRMSVRRIWVPGSEVEHVGDGEEVTGAARELLRRLALASNASVEPDGEGGEKIVGDATETAIVRLLREGGETREELLADLPRVGEVPFSSARKMMTSVHALPDGRYLVLSKGAMDRLPFAEATREELEERAHVHDQFAHDALRVMALGSRVVDELPADGELEGLERDLAFEGIVGIIDPPRPEAAEAVATARRAGIRTVMITGDHAATAGAIARQIGLLGESGRVVTGRELAAMSDEELVENVRGYSVYARVSPEDKIRIVEAWQEQGEVVAMTGDGVNDAPALKAADVGIAMGRSGTEVAKAAADMVLTDDNFATIIEAVREGRNVFSIIKRTIYFLLACNLSEIAIMLGAQILGWGTPLTPVMLLLINVLGDGIPGLSLARDRSDERIMARRPIGRTESFFAGGIARAIGQQTVAFAAVGLLAFWLGAFAWLPGGEGPSLVAGQTMCFLVVGFTSILHIFTVRTRGSVFRRTVRDNLPLAWGAAGVVAAFSLLVLVEPVGAAFGLAPIGPVSWACALGLSVVPLLVAEAFKLWDNRHETWLYRRRLVRHSNTGDE
ncbi:cation-translocating P-type ATPase [Thermophilibacter mediterraneus]|uniref:cation-translocating P-type ATPase n=1 Tax=Thermophilibacter mediterraneus TaxID=1871031 RepID=UPI000931B8CA|nr:cation-translocating P-type ATPase [Thermophilibacter mediterraneus]